MLLDADGLGLGLGQVNQQVQRSIAFLAVGVHGDALIERLARAKIDAGAAVCVAIETRGRRAKH